MSQGPIASALEEEVKRELRQRGIVVWLDKDGQYTDYVDALRERHEAGDFFAPVMAYRGSYLEMVLALANYGNGLDPEPLLIHMPGHNEESMRKTPLLEVYRAGYRFRRNLDTLVTDSVGNKVGPAELETFLTTKPATLEVAEGWYQRQSNQTRTGFDAFLEGLPLESVANALLGTPSDAKGKERDLQEHYDEAGAIEVLFDYLHRHVGLSDEFVAFCLQGDSRTPSNLSQAFGSWLMCVEYVNDLTREPRLAELKLLAKLKKPFVETSKRLVEHWRAKHPEEYAEAARLAESYLLKEELEKMRPEDLGRIDTFRREQNAILEGAIDCILEGRWKQALDWANGRSQGESFWLKRYPANRFAWHIVSDAAVLSREIEQSRGGLESAKTLEEATRYYREAGYRADQAHRHLEQRYTRFSRDVSKKRPQLHQRLRKVLAKLRADHRVWADGCTKRFASICEEHGFLPEPALRQRNLFTQVVAPLVVKGRKTAFFMVDALRFELAAELADQLRGAGGTVHLEARLAELPTLTAVGMNVLPPVSSSERIDASTPKAFSGFKTGEFTVRRPEDRVRAMAERLVENSADRKKLVPELSLAEACGSSVESLKRKCSKARLVVVHSKEIDDAGEANVGLRTFESWLRDLEAAWHHLLAVGVTDFVFTADHGFLLQDETTVQYNYGSIRDPARRHILTDEERRQDGLVTVSMTELGYDGQKGFLLFARDTAVFNTGKAGASFVHGGNSLQERVIPVLTVSKRSGASGSQAEYRVEVQAMEPAMDLHRVRVRLLPEQKPLSTLTFLGAETISLALRVPERDDVRPVLKWVSKAELKQERIVAPVGDKDGFEIFFELEGARSERVPLEVFHPDGTETVSAGQSEQFYAVRVLEPEVDAPAGAALGWEASIEDEGVRRVFVHLHEHSSVTESELVEMLGNPRKVRRFANEFDRYRSKVPFEVRIETTPSGKRYVKDN